MYATTHSSNNKTQKPDIHRYIHIIGHGEHYNSQTWLGNVFLCRYVQKGRLDRWKNLPSLSNLSILDVTIITSGQGPAFYTQRARLKKKTQLAEKEIQRLQKKLEELTRKQGECIDDAFHGDLLGIMKENCNVIKKAYPEGSFQRLFWEEQLRAASVKDSCQVRWHPLIIH